MLLLNIMLLYMKSKKNGFFSNIVRKVKMILSFGLIYLIISIPSILLLICVFFLIYYIKNKNKNNSIEPSIIYTIYAFSGCLILFALYNIFKKIFSLHSKKIMI